MCSKSSIVFHQVLVRPVLEEVKMIQSHLNKQVTHIIRIRTPSFGVW